MHRNVTPDQILASDGVFPTSVFVKGFASSETRDPSSRAATSILRTSAPAIVN